MLVVVLVAPVVVVGGGGIASGFKFGNLDPVGVVTLLDELVLLLRPSESFLIPFVKFFNFFNGLVFSLDVEEALGLPPAFVALVVPLIAPLIVPMFALELLVLFAIVFELNDAISAGKVGIEFELKL